MTKLSIIIPAFDEPYLGRTLKDILKNAAGSIEVLVNIDSGRPKGLPDDKRIKYFFQSKPLGMRGGINLCINHATGKYLMKTDAHCAFAEKFDQILKKDCHDNWLLIPRRYSLNPQTWTKETAKPIKDYHYLCYPQPYKEHKFCIVPVEWPSMTSHRINQTRFNIDETMTFQGSCWFADRKYFLENVGFLDEKNYGTFGGEQVEIGLKYWLGGGEVKVDKNTWYAHLFKNRRFYSGKKSLWRNKRSLIKNANYDWIAEHWVNDQEPRMVHKFSWLVEKFWPVPGWPEDRKLWHINHLNNFQNNSLNSPHIHDTPLCKIARKYGTDKYPGYKHGYTPIYYRLLKNYRKSFKKILEMGIGYYKGVATQDYYNVARTNTRYMKGASLKMWRDFFPNAKVFGADIRKETLFEDKRIETFHCDELSPQQVTDLIIKTGNDIDLFIDDASHDRNHQVQLAKSVLPLLSDNVMYVIEDVSYPEYVIQQLSGYKCTLYPGGQKWRDDNLILVRKTPKTVTSNNQVSIFAKPPFYRSHLFRGSSTIRGQQVADFLQANYNPEKNTGGVRIHVKPEILTDIEDGDYVDVVDGAYLYQFFKSRPKVKAIACSQASFEYLKRNLENEVVYIPQHHCNYNRVRRRRKNVKTVGFIGLRKGFTLSVDMIAEALHSMNMEFLTDFSYRDRPDVIEFYKKIDVQIIWAAADRIFKNPLKIINAASFGIPTVTSKKVAYREMEGFYVPVETPEEMVAEINKFKDNHYYSEWSEKLIKESEKYHIENVAKLYRRLQ